MHRAATLALFAAVRRGEAQSRGDPRWLLHASNAVEWPHCLEPWMLRISNVTALRLAAPHPMQRPYKSQMDLIPRCSAHTGTPASQYDCYAGDAVVPVDAEQPGRNNGERPERQACEFVHSGADILVDEPLETWDQTILHRSHLGV